jgi:uncharacterized cupin superfamily protein
MEHARVEDVDSWMSPASAKRSLTKTLAAADVALNHYTLEPGESLAFGYHSHEEQEEIFYVLAGEVTFETGDPDVEPETVTLGADEVVRFGAGEWQQGFNRGEVTARVLAVGAPQDDGGVTILRECADCGERTEHGVELADSKDALVTVCADCGAESARFS